MLTSRLNEVSETIKKRLEEKFKGYGLALSDYYVQNISVVSNDPSFTKIKNAISESTTIRLKAEAIEKGESGYKTQRTLDVLEKLAANEGGSAAAFAGAGLGIGAGLNLGSRCQTCPI